MFGFGAFAEFSFCEIGGAIAPPPPTSALKNDGFKRGERKKYETAIQKLEKSQQLRIKAKRKSEQDLRRSLIGQIAPELLPKEEAAEEVVEEAPKERKTLTIKSYEKFEEDAREYIKELNRINMLRWQRLARQKAAEIEMARLAEIDDEETLLLLI